MQCVPGFVLDPQTRRSTPPNQVRYPTDRQFVSGCSPPCLTATQLPSTTRSWLASTRTSTALMRCPLGRTDPGLAPGRRRNSSLRRRPEARLPAHGAPLLCLDPGLAPGRRRTSSLRRRPESRLPAHGAPLFAYRGRGAVSLLPALRTVRAVLPHTALRSVVIYIEIGAQERELAIG